MTGFQLDPRLAADTVPVRDLELCTVRLMNDRRFCWLILVPQRANLVEFLDLPVDERYELYAEIDLAATAMKTYLPNSKLNIGALGNIVQQLHVHVVARKPGDVAWPGPVWGNGTPVPYSREEAEKQIADLAALIYELGEQGAQS